MLFLARYIDIFHFGSESMAGRKISSVSGVGISWSGVISPIILFRRNTKKTGNDVLAVTSVAAGVDPDCRELALFPPAFDR